MPSTKNNKNLRGLPQNSEPEGVRCICVQVPDDPDWIGAFYGQLQRLSLQSIWDRDEAHTAQIVAARWLEVYLSTLEGNCSDVPCILPPPYDIDIGIEIRIVRKDEDGHWEELCGDSWCTPSGDYAVPEPEERTESTTSERKCLAAANAVNILAATYEAASDAFTSDGTQVAVYEAILGAITSGLGAWAIGFGASSIAVGAGLFFAFYELLETLTADLWTGDFTEELICLLVPTATDTAGVITFDYPAFLEGIYGLIYASGLDLEKQLLLQQVLFMLSFVGADGLNVAGGTTDITSYDCNSCFPYDVTAFVSSQSGFTANNYQPCGGFGGLCTGSWDSGNNQWDSCNVGSTACNQAGGNTAGVYISKTFTETFITQLWATFNNNHNWSTSHTFTLQLWNNGSQVFEYSAWLGPRTDWNLGTPNVLADEIRVFSRAFVSSGSTAFSTIDAIRATGEGESPW